MKLASTHIIALGWNAATEESGAREIDVSCEVTSVTWVGSAQLMGLAQAGVDTMASLQ